jgi:hypothetical protein
MDQPDCTRLEEGDVLAAPTPDGRFGAIRILRKSEDSLLVATTTYLDDTPPSLHDDRLRDVQRRNRFRFKDDPCLFWVDGSPPATTWRIGNLPLTDEERSLRCSTDAGQWPERIGWEAYFEWRWVHDRKAFEAEALADKERHSEAPQARCDALSEDRFWAIIGLLDWQASDDDAILQPAIEALAQMSEDEICGFEEQLAGKLFLLDTERHARQTGLGAYGSDYFSPDDFLYARCAAVARGREFYEQVVARPDLMPPDERFEALLYLASRAYETKTGSQMNYLPSIDYETFSNRQGWRE